MNQEDIDINSLLIKPVYLGLVMNGLVPLAFLSIAYFSDPAAAKASASVPQTHTMLFWVLISVAVLEGVAAILIRQKLFFAPMVYSRETFETDLKNQTFTNSIVIFALTMAITVYGFVFYLISDAFNPFLFFAILSVVAYQIVRPRHGFLKKVIEKQIALAEQGKFKQRVN